MTTAVETSVVSRRLTSTVGFSTDTARLELLILAEGFRVPELRLPVLRGTGRPLEVQGVRKRIRVGHRAPREAGDEIRPRSIGMAHTECQLPVAAEEVGFDVEPERAADTLLRALDEVQLKPGLPRVHVVVAELAVIWHIDGDRRGDELVGIPRLASVEDLVQLGVPTELEACFGARQIDEVRTRFVDRPVVDAYDGKLLLRDLVVVFLAVLSEFLLQERQRLRS